MGAKHEEHRRKLAELIREALALLEKPVPPDAVDDILATVGAGYLVRATKPLPLFGEPPLPPNAHYELAGALVRRFHDGLHPVPPRPESIRLHFRTGIDVEFDARRGQLPQDSAMLRDTLAILASGFWDDDDLKMEKSMVGKQLALYYIEGLG